jgi:hypothetical protein
MAAALMIVGNGLEFMVVDLENQKSGAADKRRPAGIEARPD